MFDITKYAPAIKQNVSGESIIVDDVNSNEHNLDVKVRSKNLWTLPSSLENLSYTQSFVKNNSSVIDFFASLPRGVDLFLTYKVDGDGTTTTLTGSYVFLKYKDGTTVDSRGKLNLKDSEIVQLTICGTQNPTYQRFYDIQIEYGSTATEYTPYIEDFSNVVISRYGTDENDNLLTATATTDGTVEGLTSLSPNMTLTSDTMGTIIDCKYNTDTKTYIDNIVTSLQTTALEVLE